MKRFHQNIGIHIQIINKNNSFNCVHSIAALRNLNQNNDLVNGIIKSMDQVYF